MTGHSVTCGQRLGRPVGDGQRIWTRTAAIVEDALAPPQLRTCACSRALSVTGSARAATIRSPADDGAQRPRRRLARTSVRAEEARTGMVTGVRQSPVGARSW